MPGFIAFVPQFFDVPGKLPIAFPREAAKLSMFTGDAVSHVSDFVRHVLQKNCIEIDTQHLSSPQEPAFTRRWPPHQRAGHALMRAPSSSEQPCKHGKDLTVCRKSSE